MIPPAIQNEINNHKAQLDSFLASKFIDQSLILGFTTVVQSKFKTWILTDVEDFHQLFVESSEIKQVDTTSCNSIDYLRTLWSDFHHPIVKSYQKQHAELYSLSLQSLKSGKKKFRSVEMRKLNESFEKYVSAVKRFYTSVMSALGTKYANPLIPQKYLQEFDIVVPLAEEELSHEAFHSTLSYITFLCLVGLGNVTRNAAQIRLSFVQPCKSVSAHYKHLQKSSVHKSEGKSHYIFPLLCYSKCIGLLPTMHEPYNHIGVIYNSLGQKFSAILWFLRSQFTRDISSAVGKRNLTSAFTKPWLEEAYDQAVRKTPKTMEPADVNNMLLRIIAEYFFSGAFRKRLYTEKVESDFLDVLFSESYYESFVKNTNVIAEHLTVFICFYELGAQSQQPINRENFGKFLLRYITTYLSKLKNESFKTSDVEMPLKNIRLILAFARKSQISKSCGPKFLECLTDAFNAIQSFDGDETKTKIIDAFVEGKAPIRSHYFSEDIHFKDFTPIGCQFKDFDDSHLFESKNIHLLFGSSFYEGDQGVFEFLDNEAVLRINKSVELASGDKKYREKVIAVECSRSENILRLQASVLSAKQIFGTRIYVDSERERFEVERVHVPKTQKLNTESAHRKRSKVKQAVRSDKQQHEPLKKGDGRIPLSTFMKPESSRLHVQVPPSSMGEIESMILGHAPKLRSTHPDSDTDVGLADMVSAIVSEDETRESITTTGDGLHDLSNDALTKSTESSRIESNQFLEQNRFMQNFNEHTMQHQHQERSQQRNQQLTRPEDFSYGPAFQRSAFQNSQMGPQANFQQEQTMPPAFAQYPQYYMGFGASQLPPVMPYGGNVPPYVAYPNMPPNQPNGGYSPYQVSQTTVPATGNFHGMYPPPYLVPQHQMAAGAQNGETNGKPFMPGPYSMYPQYSSQ